MYVYIYIFIHIYTAHVYIHTYIYMSIPPIHVRCIYTCTYILPDMCMHIYIFLASCLCLGHPQVSLSHFSSFLSLSLLFTSFSPSHLHPLSLSLSHTLLACVLATHRSVVPLSHISLSLSLSFTSFPPPLSHTHI